ncbi:MAG: hypothetical protein CVT79_13780 [Alphaproteobacteria bacterium HGW-Alphaproteobacteria-18]|nr:MAG: hypothetical protein CVT79_13780 [Alphaproteobacteria bacterium HGW-Alphaproteobacteria-18]
MRMAILAGALALAVTACGGTGGAKASMVKSCIDAGEDKAMCTCLADGLEKNLDAKTFSTVAKAMAQGDDKGGEIIEKLPADQQGKIMGAMMSTGMQCAFGG